MSPAEKASILTKIKEVLQETEEQISRLEELNNPIAPENSIGRVSRMDAINNKSVNENALRKAKQKLLGLKSALNRIEDTDFGKCLRCKNDIPPARILLVPQSKYCVHCAR